MRPFNPFLSIISVANNAFCLWANENNVNCLEGFEGVLVGIIRFLQFRQYSTIKFAASALAICCISEFALLTLLCISSCGG